MTDVQPRNIIANVEEQFPGVFPAQRFDRVEIQLTDPNGEWPLTPDPTRHIIVWGFQSSDNGNDWEWGPVIQREPGGLPFGSRDRGGGLPSMSLERGGLATETKRIRLAILTDADIRLGAIITVT